MEKGYKTKGFWGVLIATIGTALVSSGVLPAGDTTAMVGMGVTALGAVGYASVRAFNKGKDGKPAFKTTEFWMTLAAVALGALTASGVIAEGSKAMQVVGMGTSLLASLGYAVRFKLPPKV